MEASEIRAEISAVQQGLANAPNSEISMAVAHILYALAVTVERLERENSAFRQWCESEMARLESRMGEGGGRWPEH